MITDYARGKTPGSPEFEAYIEKTGYNVIEPREYGRLLEAAGFADVVVDDATPRFVEILEREADSLVTRRGEFLASFSEADLNYLVERWAMKVRFLQGRRHEMGHLPGVQGVMIGFSGMSSCRNR